MSTTQRIPQRTVMDIIRRRVENAAADCQAARDKFTAAMGNARLAVEWYAGPLVRAEYRMVFWERAWKMLAKRVGAAGDGTTALPLSEDVLHEVIGELRDRAAIELNGFFGSNSTCHWRNAVARELADEAWDVIQKVAPMLAGLADEMAADEAATDGR